LILPELRERVCAANLWLWRSGLVVLTWGNVSGLDREKGIWAIKPSGVPYEKLKPEDLVLLDLEGKLVEGKLRPSTDTPTHLVLYQSFPGIGGVAHSHSPAATSFAQACRPIPCLGTTHADHFAGEVPVSRFLREEEVQGAYELSTGKVIVETFRGRDPLRGPACLVAGHGPFVWGKSPEEAVRNAIALEEIAKMARDTLALAQRPPPLPDYLLRKHFSRKHGPSAYYGQAESP